MPNLSRRNFLRAAGAALAAHWIPGAAGALADDTDARPQVAITEADRYDRALVRTRVQGLLDDLGGLGDVVRPGDTVVIKTNLTGGMFGTTMTGASPVDTYVTHPEVIRALSEAVLDSGARKLYIVEAVYDDQSFPQWGHTAVAEELGAELINLNNPAPWPAFVEQPVGSDWLVYESFYFNRVLVEADVFMSVAKLKCHASAGVTLSMKNLVGLIPSYYYRLHDSDWHRSGVHGPGQNFRTCVPRVIVDLNRARPIDFALLDGIKTSQRGEGPWVWQWEPIEPGMLIAGKNAVATDSIATAAMGFDPAARSFADDPFRYCINHLQLASQYDLGPYTMDQIKIVGAPLSDVGYAFAPYEPPPQVHEPHNPGAFGKV